MPVLVEVKRSSDTRGRRGVVAQMLDYAANGTAYWPVESLRTQVESRAGEGQDGSDVLAEYLGVEEPDRFWRTVEDNLRAGRVRLIFLADRLPAELVRIIEFLNEQMRDTEVLGIELHASSVGAPPSSRNAGVSRPSASHQAAMSGRSDVRMLPVLRPADTSWAVKPSATSIRHCPVTC